MLLVYENNNNNIVFYSFVSTDFTVILNFINIFFIQIDNCNYFSVICTKMAIKQRYVIDFIVILFYFLNS